jgi:formylglycine-generating enzyme required for sulfatase activity
MRTAAEDPLGIIGKVIDERYRVVKLADEGGFSVVYRAVHLTWDQPVAIKIFTVLQDAADDLRERLLEEFAREGRLMSDLSSRCAAIVQARDAGRLTLPDGSWLPYMVLEWVEGDPLDVLLAREARAELPHRDLMDTMGLLEPIAQALDIAHRRDVAHRDIKPANIIVSDDPREREVTLKLLDFGIAKVMESNTAVRDALQRTGQHITAFTPSYGAPEQFTRDYGATGPWTDVYALALTMVEVMRGGTATLDGGGFFELGLRSCNAQNRPTPGSFGLAISKDAEAVFAKALAVQPGDRYPTLGDFWRSLHRVVHPEEDTWRSQVNSTRDNLPALTTTMVAELLEADTGETPPEIIERVRTDRSIVPPPRNERIKLALGGALLSAAVAASLIFVISRGEPSPEPSTMQQTLAASVTAAAGAVTPPETTTPKTTAPSTPCPVDMRLVTGGRFRMGSDDDAFPLWQPAHDVTLDTFCLDATEVTVAAYAACVAKGACSDSAKRPSYPRGTTELDEYERDVEAFSELCNGGKPGREQHPINCVTWHQADAYCKAAGYNLPSEAQWEFAGRGSDGRAFPWGNDAGNETYMNAGGIEWQRWKRAHDLSDPSALMYDADDGWPGTAPVGTFPRAQTQAGQMDMVGNVWEWTADWFATYSSDQRVNPKGPAAGDRKAIRGGGYNGSFEAWVNPAFRYHQLATATSHAIGFRCAADVAAAQ